METNKDRARKHQQFPQFYTKAGRLTHYSLACGYIEEFELAGVHMTLWFEGGCVYHVRAHDHVQGRRLFWESFETLTETRKCFDQAVRNIKKLSASL